MIKICFAKAEPRKKAYIIKIRVHNSCAEKSDILKFFVNNY